jgi:ribonuclease R
MAKKKVKGMKSDKRLTKKEITNRIVHLFNTSPAEPMNYKQVSAEIGATSQVNKLMVASLLEELFNDDFLTEIDRGKYKLNGLGTLATGVLNAGRTGKTLLYRRMGAVRYSLRNEMRCMP